MYFVKDPVTAGQYNVSVAIDDVVQPETAALLFDNNGVLDATSAQALNLASYQPANANAQASISTSLTSQATAQAQRPQE